MKRNIAKILTLYKQHYREKYSHELDTEYSCFGYYDGLDISEVENEKNRLSLSQGSINITDTWFGILNMAGKPELVNGSNSQQNFVLFYTDNESDTENNEELFWKEDRAFLAVMFVQVNGSRKQSLNDNINAIRRFIVGEYENNDCRIISYRLIDNADFLLAIKGNSYAQISNIVKEIQNIKSIIYVNTIFSVHSKYLKGSALKEDETLEGVRLEISAKEEGAVGKLLKKIEKELGQPLILKNSLYRFHHNSYVIQLPPIFMSDLLRLFKEEAALTHRNGLYGKLIYNINTSIENIYVYRKSDEEESGESDTKDENEQGWCEKKIELFKAQLGKVKNTKDENLYFYYHALIRSLNMLSHYEQFNAGRSIFNILFPSMQLVCEHVEKIFSLNNMFEYRKEYIKSEKSLAIYLQTIDNIIYHVIHTDQKFLVIPGYTSIIYDIPARLCLFYMAFMTRVSELLKDEKSWKYRYYLEPSMESEVTTYHHEIFSDVHERIINIRLQQRILFIPRTFLLTITHEIAHYVGDKIRHREKRLEYMIKTCAAIIVAQLFCLDIESVEINQERKVHQREILDCMKKNSEWYDECCRIAVESLYQFVQKEINAASSDRFHEEYIKPILCKGCEKILVDASGKLFSKIRTVDKKMFKKYQRMGKKKEINVWKEFNFLLELINMKRQEMLSCDFAKVLVQTLSKMYKETFADLVVIKLLDVDLCYYQENFPVSIGRKIEYIEKEEIDFRMKALESEFGANSDIGLLSDRMYEQKDDLISSETFVADDEARLPYKTYILGVDDTLENIKEYLKECRSTLESKLIEKENKKEVEEIRKTFETFLVYTEEEDKNTFARLFNTMDNYIEKYDKWVKDKIKDG